MTIVDSLKRLTKTITGKDVTGETVAEVVDGLNDNYPEGCGDTYETVAEIAVGTMTEQGGMYIADNVSIDLSGVDAGDALYFNSEEYPLTRIENEGVVIYGYNFSESGISGTPAYGIYVDPTDGTSIVSDTNAIENTTVKILKKVSGGGSITVDDKVTEGGKNPVEGGAIYEELEDLRAKIYNRIEQAKPFIVHGTADPISAKTAEITDEIALADIYNAAAANRYVAFECSLGEGNTTRIPLAGYTLSEGEYEFAFRVASDSPLDHTKVAVFTVDFENSKTGAANIITEQ